MTRRNSFLTLLFAGCCLLSLPDAGATATPEKAKKEELTTGIKHSDFLSQMGSRGLINIPIPTINGKERVFASFKSSQSQSYSYFIKSTEFNETLKEQRLQLSVPVNPDAELVLNQIKIDKSVSSAGVSSNENHDLISLGGKFTGTLEEKGDFCLGFQWISGDDAGLRQTDLETISTTRNVYGTFGAQINENLSAYLHLRQCFTPQFKAILADGSEFVTAAKTFTVSGIGLEKFFGPKSEASAIVELNYADYRSFSETSPEQLQINAGLRFKAGPVGVEINARSLTDSPTITAGLSFSM